jgi:chromosome partitioning protein
VGSIITVATSKGGGGKTAVTTCLAANLAALGYRVAVIDADRNQTFALWHAAYDGPALTCISEIRHIEVVDAAQAAAETHDVVLIDTAGFENLTAATAIATSDHVLIPCMPDRGSVIEAIKTARQTASMAKGARRDIPVSAILTRWNPRGLVERAALADLTTAGIPTLTHFLPDLSAFGKISYSGSVPISGRLGLHADSIIAELVAKAAIPVVPDTRIDADTQIDPDSRIAETAA